MREASRKFLAGAQVWVQTWAGAGSERHALLLGVTEERSGARGFVLGRGPYAPVVTCENVREILILDKGI